MVDKEMERVLDELQEKVDEMCNEVDRLRQENKTLMEKCVSNIKYEDISELKEDDLSEYIHKDFRDAREFLRAVKEGIELLKDKPHLKYSISYRGFIASTQDDYSDVYDRVVDRLMDKWL